MAFYNEKEQLYLEADAFGVSQAVSLLQVRDGIQYRRNEAPDNASLWPVAFTSKSSTNVENCNIEREVLGILHDLVEIHHCCFTHRGELRYRPQAAGSNLQGRCCEPITQAPKNTVMNPSVKHKNLVQAWATNPYFRLAIQKQS